MNTEKNDTVFNKDYLTLYILLIYSYWFFPVKIQSHLSIGYLIFLLFSFYFTMKIKHITPHSALKFFSVIFSFSLFCLLYSKITYILKDIPSQKDINMDYQTLIENQKNNFYLFLLLIISYLSSSIILNKISNTFIFLKNKYTVLIFPIIPSLFIERFFS